MTLLEDSSSPLLKTPIMACPWLCFSVGLWIFTKEKIKKAPGNIRTLLEASYGYLPAISFHVSLQKAKS